MTEVIAGRPFALDPQGHLIGVLTNPRGAKRPLGAVLWGMGVAELQAARRLSRLGVTALQIGLSQDPQVFPTEEARRIARESMGAAECRLAMDWLADQRDTQEFVLMGNCAAASLCFNTALADPRVTGLILTNPHLSEVLMLPAAYTRKLFQLKTWKRLLTGQAARGRLKALFRAKLAGTGSKTLVERTGPAQDIDLPLDLDCQLEHLLDRGVRILMVFAQGSEVLRAMRHHYGESLEQLFGRETLWLRSLSNDSHVISTDDVSAALLNETLSAWAETFLTASGQAIVTNQSAA